MAGRKKQASGNETPGWIVTFSDLMSLLLTFFVLLLSFSTISEEDFNKAMMSLQGAFGVLPRFNHVVGNMQRSQRQQRQDIEDAARKLKRDLQVEGKEKDVKIEFDAKGGLKISLPSGVLFDAGSATLKAGALPVLENLAGVLGELPDTFIEVRGHTDSQPLVNTVSYEDNYALSYFRAEAVTRQISRLGKASMEQFELVACGPNQPLATNDTPEGRHANRRVEIFVRGLIDSSTMESLVDGMEQHTGFDDPVSPRELNALR